MTIFFGAILIFGMLYLLLMIFGGMGDALDFGVDGALDGTGVDVIFGIDSVEADAGDGNLGCNVIAAFLAGFGAVGLTGSLMGWNPVAITVVALASGWIFGRVVAIFLRYVYRQQYTDAFTIEDLIGETGRITIESAAGKTGEVIIEKGQIYKYPVKEINGEALHRGDNVLVISVDGRYLNVKRTNGAASA